MKRAYADLDDLSSSSPSPKRPSKATRHTSTLVVQEPSSQTSKGSSPSTVVASPTAPSRTTSSLEDSGSNDTTSEPGSESSTSSQSDSGSSNTFSSESEFFQRPVGRDPNDSQNSDYDSVILSSESETGRLERKDYERSVGLNRHGQHEVLSVLDHRLINWDTVSTSTKSGSDSASNAESFSSTSASISDDVSQASSSGPTDNDSNLSSSSGSSSSSSSSDTAPASSNHNPTSSTTSSHHPSSSASPSPSPSPSPTTIPHPQLSTSNLSQLQSRLQTLLPQLQSANQELEVEKTAGRLGERDIEKVEENGEKYIEMELGLGVLEEKGEGGGKEEDKQAHEGDMLGRLMGKKGKRKGRGSRKVGIEEIGA